MHKARLSGDKFRPRWTCGTIALVLALTGAGCGKGIGEVKGRVTCNDHPLSQGSVMIVGSDNLPHYGPIQADGTYLVKDVPVGNALVAVTTPSPTPLPVQASVTRVVEKKGRTRGDHPARATSPPKQTVVIPIDYGDPSKSGLTLTVRNGPNAYPIALKNPKP